MIILRFCVFIILMITMYGCREEILDPLYPASNVNEPVQSVTSNTYSFSINAVDISNNVLNPTSLFTSRNKIFISTHDYKRGNVTIIVFSKFGEHLYEANISSEEDGIYTSITGSIPQKIQFIFTNFTGRLKFEISPFY